MRVQRTCYIRLSAFMYCICILYMFLFIDKQKDCLIHALIHSCLHTYIRSIYHCLQIDFDISFHLNEYMKKSLCNHDNDFFWVTSRNHDAVV